MKILIYTQYFYPEKNAAANRVSDIAEYLGENHTVNVLTGFPNHPLGKIIGDRKIKWLSKEKYANINIWRSFLVIPKVTSSKYWRYLNYFSFAFSSFINLFRITKPDILFVSSPPISLLVLSYLYAKIRKVKLVIDIRDLWPEAAISLKIIKKNWWTDLIEKLVEKAYEFANKIIVNTNSFVDVFDNYNLKYKTFYIPNGFYISKNLFIKSSLKRESFDFKVFYAGLIGFAQNVDLIIETAKVAMNRNDNIKFFIIGEGPLKKKIIDKINKYNLSNVTLFDYQIKEDMFHLINECDLGLITYQINDAFRKNIPSKMFDYMFANRPILINLEGEASKLINANNFGFLMETNDPVVFYEKLVEIKNKENLIEKGNNAFSCLKENFDKDVLLADLEKILIADKALDF
jgi:glycosyltransferase involved in cell wall biosynthesis